MHIEIDGNNKFIRTIGATSPVGSSWTFDQNVFVRVTAKILCIDQSSGHMKSFILMSSTQRSNGDNRIAGIPLITDVIGDDELEDANAKVEVDGAAINIRVVGIENFTLDWAIQLQVEILKDQTLLNKISKFLKRKWL
jgi:hypothetical protein